MFAEETIGLKERKAFLGLYLGNKTILTGLIVLTLLTMMLGIRSWQNPLNHLTCTSLMLRFRSIPEGFQSGKSLRCYRREMEIETVPVHEVEMRQKDLLPVVHPFHRLFQSDWNGRFLIGAGCSSSSSDSHEDKEKFQEKSW
ncbi:hypothetical protein ACFX2I_029360 [Malus domestica]